MLCGFLHICLKRKFVQVVFNMHRKVSIVVLLAEGSKQQVQNFWISASNSSTLDSTSIPASIFAPPGTGAVKSAHVPLSQKPADGKLADCGANPSGLQLVIAGHCVVNGLCAVQADFGNAPVFRILLKKVRNVWLLYKIPSFC